MGTAGPGAPVPSCPLEGLQARTPGSYPTMKRGCGGAGSLDAWVQPAFRTGVRVKGSGAGSPNAWVLSSMSSRAQLLRVMPFIQQGEGGLGALWGVASMNAPQCWGRVGGLALLGGTKWDAGGNNGFVIKRIPVAAALPVGLGGAGVGRGRIVPNAPPQEVGAAWHHPVFTAGNKGCCSPKPGNSTPSPPAAPAAEKGALSMRLGHSQEGQAPGPRCPVAGGLLAQNPLGYRRAVGQE